MTGRIPRSGVRATTAGLIAAAALLALNVAGASAATVVYSNIPSPLPGNVPSLGFESDSVSEFGGEVALAGTERRGVSVSVGMSSWSCQNGGAENGTCGTKGKPKYSLPITLRIYEAGSGDSVGALVFTSTQTFKIPYRPSADNVHCVGEHLGGWYDAAEGQCYHGKLFKIKFTLGRATLPSNAIISVAYNTSDYGYAPTHEPGPQDSLNVAVTGSPTVGADPLPEDAFANSTYPAVYEGLGTLGTFSVAGGWEGYQPEIEVQAAG